MTRHGRAIEFRLFEATYFSFLDISPLDIEAKLCLESSSSDYPVTQRPTSKGQDPVYIVTQRPTPKGQDPVYIVTQRPTPEGQDPVYIVTQRPTPKGQDPVYIAVTYIVYKTVRRTIYTNQTSCHFLQF